MRARIMLERKKISSHNTTPKILWQKMKISFQGILMIYYRRFNTLKCLQMKMKIQIFILWIFKLWEDKLRILQTKAKNKFKRLGTILIIYIQNLLNSVKKWIFLLISLVPMLQDFGLPKVILTLSTLTLGKTLLLVRFFKIYTTTYKKKEKVMILTSFSSTQI